VSLLSLFRTTSHWILLLALLSQLGGVQALAFQYVVGEINAACCGGQCCCASDDDATVGTGSCHGAILSDTGCPCGSGKHAVANQAETVQMRPKIATEVPAWLPPWSRRIDCTLAKIEPPCVEPPEQVPRAD